MGVFSGPDVSESGLVLALDGANFKSFKGEVTTNELLDITWIGDGGGTGTLVTDNNLRYNGYPTYYYTPGTSLNSYLNGADVDIARTSTVWTFSCYVKREDGAPITSLDVYMYYPNSDGFAAGTIQNAGNGWYRVSRTRTGTSSYIALCGFVGFASGVKYYLSGAQLEKKSYTTTFVSTNTTRGSTVATGGGWADLTGLGNNGELVNGVRENSDNLGSLVFDGTDDYITAPNTLLIHRTSNWTYSCWANFNGTPSLGTIFENGSWTNCLLIRFETNGITIYSMSSFWGKFTLTPTLGIWYKLDFIRNGNSIDFYLNGAYSQSLSFTADIQPSSNLFIGMSQHAAGQCFNGRISQASIYNRALTAAEVQQNYNATKARFGL